MNTSLRRRTALVGSLVALSLAAAACGSDSDSGSGATTTAGGGAATSAPADLKGSIKIDGSSTVAPLSERAAEDFMAENKGVTITVGTSGTGGGFEKFCVGETDISDASRPIKDSEKETCAKNGIEFAEVPVANDALSVIVNPDNDWATCLTVEQLNKIWAPDSTISNWNQVDPSFPDQKLTLYGAGTDSGTFDYFTGAINGEEGASRTDYNATEDDNVTVTGVSGDKGALGYLGFSYVEQNAGKITPVEINGGSGCVAPSIESVQDGSYKPLGRPLFIYPSAKALERPEVVAFVEFFFANASTIAEEALFVPLTEAQIAESKAAVEALAQ